jgi:hypothetical protein
VTAERGYPDDRWYPDDRAGIGYSEPERERRGGPGVPEQRYTDEQPRRGGDRGADRYASLADLSSELDRRRGERPAIEQREREPWATANDAPAEPFGRGARDQREREQWAPPAEAPAEPAGRGGRESGERSSLRRAAEGPTRMTQEPAPDGVYRSKRPAVAVAIGFAVGVLELVMVRVFFGGLLGHPFDARLTIAGGLFLMALPLFGVGLYGLFTGAARAVDMWGPRVWLRPPLAYLTVSLALMIAAGAAA